MKRTSFVGIALVALAVTACGTAPSPAAYGPATQMAAKRLTNKPQKEADFTGLKVKGIESLPVRCPCFKLIAEHKGTTYEVRFETGFGKDSVRDVQATGLARGSEKAFGKALFLAAQDMKDKQDAATVEAVATELMSAK